MMGNAPNSILVSILLAYIPYDRWGDILLSHRDSYILLHSSVYSVNTEAPEKHKLLKVIELSVVSHWEW